MKKPKGPEKNPVAHLREFYNKNIRPQKRPLSQELDELFKKEEPTKTPKKTARPPTDLEQP